MSEIVQKVTRALNPASTRTEEVEGVTNNPELTNAFNQEQAEHAREATIEIQDTINTVRTGIKDLFWKAPQNFLKRFAKTIAKVTLLPPAWAVLKLKGKLIDFPIKTAISGVLASVTKVLNIADKPFIGMKKLEGKINDKMAVNDNSEMPKAA